MKNTIEKTVFLFSILTSLTFFASTTQAQIDDSQNTKFKEVCKQWQEKYTNGVQQKALHTTEGYGGNGWAESCRLTDQSFTLRKTIGDRDIFLDGIQVNIFYGSEGEDLRKQTYKVDIQKYYQSIKSKTNLAELIEIPNGSIVMMKFRSQINPEIIYTSGAALFQDKDQCSLEIHTMESWNVKEPPSDRDPFWKIDRNNQTGQTKFIRSVADDILNNPICTEKTSQVALKNTKPAQSNFTQALVENPPKESDFQKIPKSNFKKVNPVGTASATTKPATESANITGSIFIGKVGQEEKILVDLPNGTTATLADDQTAFEGEISGWKLLKGGNKPLSPRPLQVSIYAKDCHSEILEADPTRRANDWSGNNLITKIVGDCTYSNDGDPLRVFVDTGQVNFKTSSGVEISAQDSDFGVSFETTSGQSIVEIYNGSITITNKAGQSKTISTIYGSQINRIEVDKNGVMNEKIAIPQSQWEKFLASNQKDEKETDAGSNLPIVPAIVVLTAGGVIFFLYRTGKLLPLYKTSGQKITELLKKTSKEKKTD